MGKIPGLYFILNECFYDCQFRVFHCVPGEADGLCAAGTEWSCASSGACIPIVKRNNGVNDCYDHSDEGKLVLLIMDIIVIS